MRRWWLVPLVAGVAGIGGISCDRVVGWLTEERVTTSRLSPDETLRAVLVELHVNIQLDRNLSIRLDRRKPHDTVNLLQSSNDEGKPAGSERFVWSKDGSKLLLLGRHFYVRDDLLLDTGDQAYFLHDRRAGRSWINADVYGRLPPLTADLIAAIDWAEPVVLKPRAKVDPDSHGNPE